MQPLLLWTLSTAWAGSLSGGESPSNLNNAYEARRVAVLIGVDQYEDPSLDDLAFAGKDARDLAQALQEQGNFDELRILDHKDRTHRAGILAALQEATVDLQRDDTFLLYLSGHGTLTIDPTDGTQLWFMPADSQLDLPDQTGINISWLEEQVAKVTARRRVLMMDTCHNGRDKSSLTESTASTLASMRGDPPPPRSFREVSESEARLYAAQYYQPAMEDADLQNGVYTHYLLESLREGAEQADLDGDGLVDVTEAHDWARDKTIAHTGGMQVPRAEYRIVGREVIYLAGNEATRSAAERALLTAQDALLAKGRVLINGQSRGVLPELVAVEPGTHTIEVTDIEGRRLLKRRLRIRAGETVMLEDLFVPRKPGWEFLGGMGLRDGIGADTLHPTTARLEINRYDFTEWKDWLELGVHGRVAYATGTLKEQGPYVSVTSGELSTGVSASLRLIGGLFQVGPELDLALPWRVFEDLDGTRRQSSLTAIPGVRAQLRLPVSRQQSISVRYSSRLVPFSYDGEWNRFAEHHLAIGWGQQD